MRLPPGYSNHTVISNKLRGPGHPGRNPYPGRVDTRISHMLRLEERRRMREQRRLEIERMRRKREQLLQEREDRRREMANRWRTDDSRRTDWDRRTSDNRHDTRGRDEYNRRTDERVIDLLYIAPSSSLATSQLDFQKT